MSIVKETLLHLLRRKWKLILVVGLFGTALVATTYAYDVAGIIEAQNAALEAMGDGPVPMSQEDAEERGEALARGMVVRALFAVLSFFFSLGIVLVGMLMPSGVVANERSSGAIMLWAQHPMPLNRFYLHRYAGIQLANLTAQALFGVAAVLAVLPAGEFPATETGVFVRICLLGAVACAVSFATTALGIRRAAFLALAYYAASSLAATIITVGTQFGATGTAKMILDALPFVIFPEAAIGDFVNGFESGVAWDWKATGMVLYHFALWTGIAWLGLIRIERKPLRL